MDENLPVGFTPIRVMRSETCVHTAKEIVVCTTFAPAPLRLVAKPSDAAVPSIRKTSFGPDDNIDLYTAWRKRKADHDADKFRRLQVAERYLIERAARQA